MKTKSLLLLFFMTINLSLYAQNTQFNGVSSNINNLYMLSNAKTRSISPENFTGEKGSGGKATLQEGNAANAARDLGQGWKVNPYIHINPDSTFVIADIKGSGAIQQIWMTPTGNWRFSILRIYWDHEKEPSVEVPLGDFFAVGWNEFRQISSIPVCVNPGRAFNSYWVMPFREGCRIEIENVDDNRMTLYYQINYTLTDVPEDAAYFHAQFRRINPLKYKEVYTIVDDIKGKGHYVGTYMNWGSNSNGWWGEGEIKFFIDGDKKFPTICGTGVEDYFCGSYCFTVTNEEGKTQYKEYSTPYAGFFHYPSDNMWVSQNRFGLYRWHITDPVRFEKDLRVTIQALGWRDGGRYLPLMDDISSVAYWYQVEPHQKFPAFLSKDLLEIK